MTEMEPDRKTAERAIREAYKSNPGGWAEHSRYVAEACKNIASHCKGLSGEKAYVLGLLHDIGRYAGVSSEKHLIDGYRYCAARGWKKAAQICISHAFMIQDINTSYFLSILIVFLFSGFFSFFHRSSLFFWKNHFLFHMIRFCSICTEISEFSFIDKTGFLLYSLSDLQRFQFFR